MPTMLPQGAPKISNFARQILSSGGSLNAPFRTENVPVTPDQVRRLLQGESATSVLGPAIAPIQQPIAPGFKDPVISPQAQSILDKGGTINAPFKTEQLPISGLNRPGKYMYGGPEPTPGFAWRTPETVPPPAAPPPQPALPPPRPPVPMKPDPNAGRFMTEQIPITPEQSRRLRAGEDPSTVLNQAPSPTAPTPVNRIENIPITREQGQRLRRGEDPNTVLGQTLTPVAPVNRIENIPITRQQGQRLRQGENPTTVLGPNIFPSTPSPPPLPPSMTPESVGAPTETLADQLRGLPWEPMHVTGQMVPDSMRHVTTDPSVLSLMHNLIPDAVWDSHTMRPGPPAEPRFSPTPAPVPGLPWIS